MKIKIILLLITFISINASIAEPNQQLPKEDAGPWVVNVYYQDETQLRKFIVNKEPWTIDREQKFFTVSVDNLHEYQELFSYGFRVEINKKMMRSQAESKRIIEKVLKQKSIDELKTLPDRPCIKTVEETFTAMDDLVNDYPLLATIVPIGESWEKETPGGLSGYDMRVIKITNSAIAGDKPKLFTTSSIHARELAPAELSTRFAEYLLNNYATNADAKWLVDHREIHLLLQGNPDGRKKAEVVEMNKRKNENNNFCPSGNKGIDMNRNFIWMWNQGSGSSPNECLDNYRGPSAQSESENTAIDTHLKTLFDDNRGINLNDAAPDDTTGIYIDIHSYSDLVLWPYGFSDPGSVQLAPNHSQLQTLGRKFAWFNNYTPMPSNDLYGADGAADDNAYGQLGVAAYTFELGSTGFRPQCSYFENTIVEDNLKALIYAAKVADTPYITASGPDIENIALDSATVTAGTSISVTGIATDNHFKNTRAAAFPPVAPHVLEPDEAMQNITSVAMFVDEVPWDVSSTPIVMTATDGNYNAISEDFTGQIDTTGFTGGQHIIYLQSTDAAGVTGAPYAKFFNVVNAADLGIVAGVITDSLTNLPIATAIINLDTQQTITNTQGEFNFPILVGNYTLTASKQGYVSVSINNINVASQQTTTQDIQLQPVCAMFADNVDTYTAIADADAAGWSHGAVTNANDDWSIDTTGGSNSSHAFRTEDVGIITDKFLISPELSLTTGSSLEFWHKYNFENTYDGAVLEITSDNGVTWTDLLTSTGNSATYNTTLDNGFNNPLGGRLAWSGQQATFAKIEIDLSSFTGQTIKIRWRFGSDSEVAAGFWHIDDIKVLAPSACVAPVELIFENSFE